MDLLGGRIAVVTGAGGGIGRGHARLLASEGAHVVVNDLDAGRAEATVSEITGAGGVATASSHDISTWKGGDELVRCAIDAYGRLDILVNNAGILRDAMTFNMTEPDWDSVIDVHLKGHMSTCHARGAALAGARQGRRHPERAHRQHRVRVGALRSGRAGELLGGEGRHRRDDDRDRA